MDTKNPAKTVAWLSLLVLLGCDLVPEPPGVEQVKGTVGDALAAANALQPALELLGLLPEEGCGEPRSLRPVRFTANLQEKLGCAAAELELGEVADTIRVRFPPEGCWVEDHVVTGELTVTVSGGDDRQSVELDLRRANLDGQSIPVRLGYQTCGGATQYSAIAQGSAKGLAFDLDLAVTLEKGRWPWSPDRYAVDGHGALTHGGGTERLAFEEVRYTLGDLAPEQGSLRIETSGGSSVQATFGEGAEEMELVVNGGTPLRIRVPELLPFP